MSGKPAGPDVLHDRAAESIDNIYMCEDYRPEDPRDDIRIWICHTTVVESCSHSNSGNLKRCDDAGEGKQQERADGVLDGVVHFGVEDQRADHHENQPDGGGDSERLHQQANRNTEAA